MAGFAVIDFETTGLVPERSDRIVEIGVVLLDASGARQGQWSTLINPQRDVGATSIHGISAKDVFDAPLFSDISRELLSLTSGRTVVAHNASFDMRFLHSELVRAGHDVHERPPALCTMKWSRRLLGVAKLEQCCAALGIPLQDAHSALADAEATASLLARISPQGSRASEWHAESASSATFSWPTTASTKYVTLQPRARARSRQPGDWFEELLENAWVGGESVDEAEYILALNIALLDFHLSRSEEETLSTLALNSGLSPKRIVDIHRAHLQSLANEAFSDGVITQIERGELESVAAHVGLDMTDLDRALRTAKSAPQSQRRQMLSPGDRIVFTGQLSLPREDWIRRVTSVGLTTGGVTKRTAFVVTSDPDSLSGKSQKARAYGIPIINEAGFQKYLLEYELARL